MLPHLPLLLGLYSLHCIWTVEMVKKAWGKLKGEAMPNMPAVCTPEPIANTKYQGDAKHKPS